MGNSASDRWRLLLIPFSWIFGLVVRLRNSLYDQGVMQSASFSLPILCVGNITVGGTGKTPHVEYLVELLKDRYRLATLSRGYLRKTRDFRIASGQSTSMEIGDEPAQIKFRFPEITVAVDRSRVNGVKELMKEDPPLELIILDDAFQHRALKAGFYILLIDYNRPMFRDRLLPSGNLREPATGRSRANVILVSKTPVDMKPIEMREYVKKMNLAHGQHLFFTSMKAEGLVQVFSDQPVPHDKDIQENTEAVLIISGVVNPASLVAYARNIHPNISELHFRDHHRYSEKDVRNITILADSLGVSREKLLILTTEKDAAKLRELNLPEDLRACIHALRIRVEFLNEDGEEFQKIIDNYVTSNRRSSILYKEEN